jgi:hypothetical protein
MYESLLVLLACVTDCVFAYMTAGLEPLLDPYPLAIVLKILTMDIVLMGLRWKWYGNTIFKLVAISILWL